MPEKIFYNTGAPGCLIFLNRNKPKEKKARVLFIYAGKDFEKLKNMNKLRDEDIAKIVRTYKDFKDEAKCGKIASINRIRENDYNLSITRYVDVFEEEEPVDIAEVWKKLRILDGVEWRQNTNQRDYDVNTSHLLDVGVSHSSEKGTPFNFLNRNYVVRPI